LIDRSHRELTDAEELEDDDEPFEKKMEPLTKKLEEE
jgi:hypothetical protein